jgi:hypothetical protein
MQEIRLEFDKATRELVEVIKEIKKLLGLK